MSDKLEKACPCKAVEELSAEDVENVAGGYGYPVVGGADGAGDGLLDPEYCGDHPFSGFGDVLG
ncbi:MAG: hypothetical protein HUJ65_07520 [Oscillospiraceae bacterium]|nr:hypothetical protein [Oscillospiraceae bacterium]